MLHLQRNHFPIRVVQPQITQTWFPILLLPSQKKQKSMSTKTLYPPALIKFHSTGCIHCLEEFASWIDTPQLVEMHINFICIQIDFDSPQLAQFSNWTPTLRKCDEAHVWFCDFTVTIALQFRTSKFPFDNFQIYISYRGQVQQLLSIMVCNCSWYPISSIKESRTSISRVDISSYLGRIMPLGTTYSWNSYFCLLQWKIFTCHRRYCSALDGCFTA